MIGKIEKFFQNPIPKVAILTLVLVFIFSHFRTDVSVMASDERVSVFPQQVSIESNLSFLDLNNLGTSSLWFGLENSKVVEGMPSASLVEFKSDWAAQISFGDFVATSNVVFDPESGTDSLVDVVVSTSSGSQSESGSNSSENESLSPVENNSEAVESLPTENVSPVIIEESADVVDVVSEPVVLVEPVSVQAAPEVLEPSTAGESSSPVESAPADSSSDSAPTQSSSAEGGDVSSNFWNNFKKGGASILNSAYGLKLANAQEQSLIAEEDVVFSEPVVAIGEESVQDSVPVIVEEVLLNAEKNQGLKDSLIFTNFVTKNPLEKNEISNIQLRLSLAGQSNFANDEFLIEYSLTGNNWEEAGRLPLFREASNASNGGYFLYAMPVFSSWQDVEQLQVRVSYLNPDISSSTDLLAGGVKVYLDSVWLEIDYTIKGKVKGEEELLNQSEDVLGKRLFYDQDEVDVGGKKIKFEYTDDNSDESLIIKTDRANYVGLSEAEVYLSVTNSTDQAGEFGLQAYFPVTTGNIESIEKLNREATETNNPVYGDVKLPCQTSWLATSTTGEDDYFCADSGQKKQCAYLEDAGLTCILKDAIIGTTPGVVVDDSWEKINLNSQKLADKRNFFKKIFDIGPKKKSLPSGFAVKKSTGEDQYPIEPGETQFFKVKVSFPQGSSGEFYFEAIGQNVYGLLDPWWNASWDYERPVNITYAGDALTDYQVSIFVDTATLIAAGKMQSDCDDIRFADSNRWTTNNELSYYLEPGSCNRANTRIWVKVPSLATSKTIYMYYGSAAAVSASNGVNTFVYFQDFESNHNFDTGSLSLSRKASAARFDSMGLSGSTANVKAIRVRNGVNSGRNLIWETWVSPLSSSTIASLPAIQIAHPNGASNLFGYSAYLDTRGGIDLAIRKDFDQAQILSSFSTYTITTNQWYFMRLDWRKDGLLSAFVYPSATSTTAVAYCSSTNTSYTDGEYGVGANQYAYWDNYRIRKMATSSINISLAAEVQIINHPPTDPISLVQYQNSTSTVLTNGEWSNSQNIYLSATSTDKDADAVTVFYQLVATGTAFSTATSVPGVSCFSGTAYDSCSSKIWSSRGGWLDAEFPYRSKITILASKVDADLTDFPVFIDLSRLGASNSFWRSVRSATGGDLMVANAAGLRLPLEVVGFSTSTKVGQIYFKADNLYNLTDTDFYLYYGSSTATQPASTTTYGARNVWSGYGGVWHLDYNGTGVSGDWRDSSANSNYSSSTANYPTRVAGPLGYGQQFDGVNDIIRFEKNSSLEPATDFTLSAWIWWGNAYVNFPKPIHYGADGVSPYGAYMFQPNNMVETSWQFQVGKSTYETITSTGNATGTWAYMTGVYDFYTDSILYVNGVSRANTSAGVNVPTVYATYGLSFGANGNGTGSWFNGRIDEVRLYPGVRSPEWISTEYNNQINVGTFISTSSQETIAWFDTEYPHRIMLNVLASQVDADLSNFPVYVNLSNFGSNNSFWVNSKKNSDGGDLLITNSTGVRLPLEVVTISTSTKVGEVYFKADVIRDLTDTNFYLYYGSSTAAQPAASATYGSNAVWSSYLGVWHLNESGAGAAGDFKNSASASYNSTNTTNQPSRTSLANGKLGYAQAFDNTDRIEIAHNVNLNFTSAENFTLSVWAYEDANTSAWRGVVVKSRDVNPWYGIWANTANQWHSANPNLTSSNTISAGSWTYITLAQLANTSSALYENGSSVATGGASGAGSTGDLWIGGTKSIAEYLSGYIDEVRISKTAVSAQWVSTEYKNQNSPGTFLATATPEVYTNYTSRSVNIPSVPESGSPYKWQAIACDNRNICSMWVPYNSTLPNFWVDTINPSAPGNLTLNKKTETSITLNFGATTTEANFAEYKIFYKAGSSGVTESDILIGSSSDADLGSIIFNRTSTTTISGLMAGTQYVFKIWAYDIYGHKTASLSELIVTTAGYPRDPEDLNQFRASTIPMPNGGWSNTATVNLFSSSTADLVYYELIPIASSFTTATTTPATACTYDIAYNDCASKRWINYGSFWYDYDFSYRTKITAQNSAVTADLTSFPLYVNLSALGVNHSFWNKVKANGGDIIVTNATGVRLPVEVVKLDTTAKTGEMYFQADLIEDATSTDFYIYYGSSTASQPASSSAYGMYSVWSKPFGAVYHFNNGSFKNSASSSWNGANSGSISGSGMFGDAIVCNGVDQYAVITDTGGVRSPFEDNLAGFTVSAWGKQGIGTEAGYMLHKDTTGWRVWQRSSNLQFGVRNSANATWLNIATSSTQTAGAWYSVNVTMNSSQTSQNLYINNDAVINATIAARPFNDVANNLTLCADTNTTTNWPGTIDELRVARTERSSTWITTQYNNQTLITFFATTTETAKSSLRVDSVPISGIPNSATGYKWQALSCNGDGCSELVAFNVTTPNFSVDTIAPTAPGNLTVDSRANNSITLNFGSASTETNFAEYKIFYRADTGGVYESDSLWGSSSDPDLGSRTFSSTGSTTITGLLSNTDYVFNIWAYDLAGNKASGTAEVNTKTTTLIVNPTDLNQWKTESTLIPNGQWTNYSTVQFSATSSGAQGDVALYYQIIGTTSSFTTSTSTPSGSCVSGTDYNSCASKIWRSGVASGDWYDADYLYRSELTVNDSQVDADLSNFPVYVDLSRLGASHGFWSNTRRDSSGGDIVVTDSAGNRLPLEVVFISTSTKTGEIYFKAGLIENSTSTNFYIYYGSSTAVQPGAKDTYGRNNVWSNSYKAVWHLQSTSPYDSVGFSNNGTPAGGVASVAGKLGSAADFNATGDYINIGVGSSTLRDDDLTISGAPGVTWSYWVYGDTTNDDINEFGAGRHMVAAKGDNGTQHWALWIDAARNTLEIRSNGGWAALQSTNAYNWPAGQWSHVALTYNPSNRAWQWYINGAPEGNGTLGYNVDNFTTDNVDVRIGRHYNVTGSDFREGMIDGVRIANTPRSSTWISTEYKNQNAPASFLSTTTEDNYSNHSNSKISVNSFPDSADGYRWQALACNSDGCSKNWVAYNASTPNFRVDTLAPTTPGNLAIDGKNSTDVTLNFGSATWDANFSEYKVFYKAYNSGVTESGSLWGQASDADLASRTFNGTGSTTVINLNASTTYYFNIWAYDQAGNATKALTEVFTTTNGGLFAPTSLQQYRYATTTLPNGSWTNSSTVRLYATSSNSGGDTSIYYELIANGTSFKTATTTPVNACYTGSAFNSCTNKVWTNMDPTWWNRSWLYRRKITFGTNHSALPIGYTASTTMDTRIASTNVSLASGNDVRVVWQLNGGVPIEIDRIGSAWDNASTNIQFRLQTDVATSSNESSDGSYYIYYNNPSAGVPKSSSSNVFYEYDEFDNNSIGSQWTLADNDNTAGTTFTETSSLRILANGSDVWNSPDDYYGAIFRTVPGNFEATTRIIYQGNANGWAKAGIMVKNNMAVTQANNGYGMMSITPTNNFAEQYDSNGDGYLDAYSGGGTTAYPSCVRLVKTANVFQGYYSTNCTSYTSLPTFLPSGVNATQNVGLFSSSHASGVLSAVWFDWIKIIKTTADKEETSLGTEERRTSLRTPISVVSIPDSSIGYKWQALACNQYSCSPWNRFDLATPNFVVDTIKPTAPGALTLVARRTTSLTLGFGSASTETNFAEYKIYYRQGAIAPTEADILYGSSSEVKLASRTYSNGTSTVISDLLANTQYTFTIFAYDLSGQKASSSPITLQTSNTVTEVYNYTSGATAGWINSSFAWDSTDDTYAYRLIPANSVNDSTSYLLGTANNSPTSTKTIFAVELGIEGYTGDPDVISYKIVPIFSGLTRGATSTILGTQFGRVDGDGTYYFDITNDGNAPAVWTWNDIINLDTRIHALNASTSNVTAYVDQIRLRVSVDAYPELTQNLSQRTVASTTNLLPANYWLNQSSLVLRADGRDPDAAEMPTVFFQFVPTSTAHIVTTTRPVGACISGTAYDSCASKVWLVNYVGAPADFSATPFVATSAVTSIPDGSYHWQAITCDDDDICSPSWTKFSTATSTHIRIDTTAPTIPGWLRYVSRTSGSLTLQLGTTTAENNFSTYRIFYRKSSTTAVTEADSEFFDTNLLSRTFNGATSTIVAGLSKSSFYTLNIWAYDRAGNKASSSRMLIASTTSGYILNQTSYIIENDDGATVNLNSSPGIADAQLANVEKGQRLVTRFQLQNTGTDQTYNKRYKIQFENNTDTPGAWTDVGGATAISHSYGLSGANGDALTGRKAAANGLAWVNGIWHENINLTNMYNLPTGNYTEFAFALQTVNALPGKTYRLRLIDGSGSSTLDTYTNYPTLVISGLANKKYSKNVPSSLLTNNNDLTYFLDNLGYSDVSSDNATRDYVVGAPAYTVYNFATKHKNYNSAITATWNGQSSLAPTTNTVYLQLYRFGTTNAWVTMSSNNSTAANTDFTLTGGIGYKMSEYYDANGYVYWRVYQATGNATLRTDYYNLATSSLTTLVGQKHYRWRNDNGSVAQGGWYDDDYVYRKKMTLDPDQVPGVGTLSNFPVLVSFTDLDLRGTSSSGYVQGSLGWDILFTNASGTQIKLDYQIEKYDRTTGEIVAWVEVPNLYSEKDTPIYMYYGNATTSAPTASVSGTWNSNYKAVWHFDETGASTTRQDSTANANNASTEGYDGDEDGASNIDGTDDFDGTNDHLSVVDSNSLDITGDLTLSGWFNPDTTAKPLDFETGGYARYQIVGMRWTSSGATDCTPDSSVEPYKMNAYGGALYGSPSWLTNSFWRVVDSSLATVHAGTLYTINFNSSGLWNGAADNSESYVSSYIYSPRDKQVTFSVGSDDSRVIWINGHHVHQECAGQGLTIDDQSFNYTLKQGWNTFVMMVANGTGGYASQWRVSSTTEGMKYTSNPTILIDKKEYQISLKAGYLSAFYGTTTVDYPIASSSWQSFALVGDTAGMNLYVNGLSRASTTFSSGATANTQPIRIGYLFDGKLDEMRVLNVKSSKDWVSTVYNSQLNRGTGAGKFIKTVTSQQTIVSTVATWRENEDVGDPTMGTAITKNTNLRLRLSQANTSGGIATNYNFRLQYASTTVNCSSGLGTWHDLPVYATTQHFEMSSSTWIINGEPTARELLNAENYTFIDGSVVEENNTTSTYVNLGEDQYTELEWALRPTRNASDGATYCFRAVRAAGTLLDYYDRYAELTLAGNTNTAPAFTYLPDDGGSATSTPTLFGTNVNFSALATDPQSNEYYLAVCRTNSIVTGNGVAPTCPGGSWCISNLASSSARASCSYSAASSSESLDWYAFACDLRWGAGVSKCSASSQGETPQQASSSPFKINHRPAFTALNTTVNFRDPGGTFTISATGAETDVDGPDDTMYFYACNTNSATFGTGCASGQTLCSSTAVASPNPSCSFTDVAPTPAGASVYYGFIFDSHGASSSANSRSSSYSINNVLPTLGSLVLNGGNPISLNIKGAPDTTVQIVNTSVTDQNGCQSLVSATGVVYLSSAFSGYNCTANNNNCYQINTSNCVLSNCSGASDAIATYTCTAGFKYYAIPTNDSANNPWEGDNWISRLQIFDGSNYVATSSPAVELNTNTAIDITENLIDFGNSLNPGDNTGATNQQITVVNCGNSPLDGDLAGSNMRNAINSKISANKIQWNLSGFSYGTGSPLPVSPQTVDLVLAKPTTATDVTDLIYWGLGLPATTTSGIYEGTTTMSATLDISDW